MKTKKGVIKIRKVSSSSVGFTIPVDLAREFNIIPGSYKYDASLNNNKIKLILKNIFDEEVKK